MTERSNFTNIFSDPVSDNFKLISLIDLDLKQNQPNKKIVLNRKLSS